MSPKFLLIFLLFLVPVAAHADDNVEDSIQKLRWVAIGAGVVANLPFILISKYRRYAVQLTGNHCRWQEK